MVRRSIAAIAVAFAVPALAASSPGAIAIRVPCELPGVSGAPAAPTPLCEHLSGWFEGRIDWISEGTVLFSEYGPFLAVRASQTGRPGPSDTRAAAELVVFADGNGDATDFDTLYAGAATSILRDPGSLRIAIHVRAADGTYQLAVEQAFVPVASALWSVHSLDTDGLVADLAAEREARLAADAALGTRLDDETARALAAEAALSGRIDAERGRATAAESVLGADLAAERVRATGAEDAIAGLVETERLRALGAESALGGSVDAERDRATAAEGLLSAEVDAETGRALAAEAGLRTGVDAVEIALASYQNMLRAPGPLNNPGNPVDFTRLKNVPGRVANGYLAGAGLFIAGDLISAVPELVSGSLFDGRFVNASSDTVGSLAVTGNLCLDGDCRGGWQRVNTFAADGNSQCTCSPSGSLTMACCYSFGIPDPLGCLSGLTWYPAECGTFTKSVAASCSCPLPAVSATCPWVGGSQGFSQLTSCLLGTWGGGDTCAGSAGETFSASATATGSVWCDCERVLGFCGVLCPRTLHAPDQTGSALSSRALCAALE